MPATLAAYVIKRLLSVLPTMFLVLTLVFLFLRLMPGDPIDLMLGENAPPEARAQLIAVYHLDASLGRQYVSYLGDVLSGNLGKTYNTGEPVAADLWPRYANTLRLGSLAFFWAIILSLPFGILAATRKGQGTDRAILTASLFGISMPTFYLGPLLALIFAVWLDWLPVSGSELRGSIILPSLTLGLAMAALLTRFTRASLVDVLKEDYVRTAKAKGLGSFAVVIKHAFRTALIPVISILGLQLGALLTGTVVTEKVFGWRGLGTLLLEAITRREYALVQACVLLIAATYVVVNLCTDLLLAMADPRLELAKEAT